MRDPSAAPLLAAALHDADERVHAAAETSLWALWSLSGDAAVDAQLQVGMRALSAAAAAAGPAALNDALDAFTAVTEAAPLFAEGWNKQATVLYLLKQHAASLAACERVVALNPAHFGALSGGGMCALSRGDLSIALRWFKAALSVNPRLEVRRFCNAMLRRVADVVAMLPAGCQAVRGDAGARGGQAARECRGRRSGRRRERSLNTHASFLNQPV